MRVVFLGSPDFALPTLRRLIDSDHEIVAVVTQPDRPAGRGRKPAPPPVKVLALEHGLRVLQPRSLSRPESADELRALAPDVGVIAAYGQILKQPVLDLPRLGVLNVHASLLPRWRGASPIPAAILAGDAEAGATIMQVRLALDAGPMLDRVRVAIRPQDTAGTLAARIAEAGAELLMSVLPRWEAGEPVPEEQDESLATYAPQIEKEDALIDWEQETAEQIARKIRAYNPWPIAYTLLDGQPIRILECAALFEASTAGPVGTISAADAAPTEGGAGFRIATIDGALGVVTVQGPGGKAMPATAYLRGHGEIIGKRFG
jgi:methionyl-tRNA formyltransferase